MPPGKQVQLQYVTCAVKNSSNASDYVVTYIIGNGLYTAKVNDFQCTTNEYLYPNNSCLSYCNSPLNIIITGYDKLCVNPCQALNYLYWNSSCKTNCNAPLLPLNTSMGLFCIYPCSNNQSLFSNGTCINQCPWVSRNESGWLFCDFFCNSTQYLYRNYSCMSICSRLFYDRSEERSPEKIDRNVAVLSESNTLSFLQSAILP